MSLNPDKFYHSRQADWQQLTDLLDLSERNISHLTPTEVKTLGHLYRVVTSDLAIAQRDFPHHKVTRYLNQLVARGHAVIYQGEPLAWRRFKQFILYGLPQTFRESLPFFWAAAAFFLVPALIAGFLTQWQPEAASWLLPDGVQRLIPMIEEQELWVDIPIAERPYSSSFIMRNNIQVSFLAFGSGISAGLFTTYVLIFNGLLLGGLLGLTGHHGVGFELWTFIIAHGVIEISTIFIAGGSGLMIGWAIISPGLLRRQDALRLATQKAVRLVMMAIPILIIAGLIEGFISPNENISWQIKFGIGIGSGVLLYSYLLLSGRRK